MSPKIVHTADSSLLDVVQKLLRPRHQPLRRLHADAVGDTAERHWRQSPRHVGTRVAPIKAGELDDTLALLRREPVAASCGKLCSLDRETTARGQLGLQKRGQLIQNR